MRLLTRLRRNRLFPIALQITKYSIVGVASTLISHGVCYIFIFINVDYIYIGQILGFIISVMNTYYWNNRYTFKGDDNSGCKHWKDHARAILRVYVAYSFSVLLGFTLTWLMRNLMGISEWYIPIILLFICTPINFIINKFWAFKERMN